MTRGNLFSIKYLLLRRRWHVACIMSANGKIPHDDRDPFVAHDDAATQKARLREAILRYIKDHPFAADTPEGILSCWLSSAGFEDAADYVTAVLDELVAHHQLQARPLPDGNVLYLRGDVPCV